MQNSRFDAWRLAGASALLLAAAAFAFYPLLRPEGTLQFRLGIDMQGGVRLVYEIDKADLARAARTEAESAEVVERTRHRLLRRFDRFESKDRRGAALEGERVRILIELLGLRNTDAILKAIGRPQRLSYRAVKSVSNTEVAGAVSHRVDGRTVWVTLGGAAFHAEAIDADKIELDTRQPQEVAIVLPVVGGYEGTVGRFMYRNRGKQIAVMLDDTIARLPVIQSDWQEGPTGGLTYCCFPSAEKANTTRWLLASGPLPVEVELVEKRVMSPLLGADLVESLKVGLAWGIAAMSLFLLLVYFRYFWFVVVFFLTLGFEAFLVLGFLNLQLFELTLVQIASLALVLAMAVDSLVLVFEDLRRELDGKRFSEADITGLGFRAFRKEVPVVLWASITTLVSLLGLMSTSQEMRGFFYMIAWGMVVNALAIAFAYALLGVSFLAKAADRALSYPFLLPDRVLNLLDFGAVRRPLIALTAVLGIGAAAVAYRPGPILGLEFAGGTEVSLRFADTVELGVVRDAAARAFDDDAVDVYTDTVGPGHQREYLVRTRKRDADAEGSAVAVLLEVLEGEHGVVTERYDVSSIGSLADLGEVVKGKKPDDARGMDPDLFLGLWVLPLLCGFLYRLSALFVLLALGLDVAIMLGFLAVSGIPLSLPVLAAVIAMIGYSINDSIIVCHHTKQLGIAYTGIAGAHDEFPSAVLEGIRDFAVRQTSARILLTTVSTALATGALWWFGKGVVAHFGAVCTVGVLSGMLSSVVVVGFAIKSLGNGPLLVGEDGPGENTARLAESLHQYLQDGGYLAPPEPPEPETTLES